MKLKKILGFLALIPFLAIFIVGMFCSPISGCTIESFDRGLVFLVVMGTVIILAIWGTYQLTIK